MSRFGVLKRPTPPAPIPTAAASPEIEAPAKVPRQDRAGRVMVGGHFTANLSRAVKVLAAEQGTTVQALVGEALDDLLRKHGKHPFGER